MSRLVTFKCPYPDCNYMAKSWSGLKQHVHRKHRLDSECPVCGQRFQRVLGHLAQCALRYIESGQDERYKEHAIYYIIHHTTASGYLDLYQECVVLLLPELEVEDD